ncbi:MAG: heme-binding protein [Haloarculaceae archaeon]
MPDRRDPPPTDEGWYTLHDFRTIDWGAWREATERERQRALEEGIDFFQSALAVEDADEGASALYSILGHKADLLVLHLRPSTADTGALERRFEQTELARFTERTTSFVSVTEASGYSERARDYFTGDLDEDSGLYNYIQTRLKPSIPDATHVCFYPMDKRRQPEQNWYDLSFEERAEHMDAHGDIGRDYGGKVQQMITGAIAMDDWEWGVTLWGDDLTDMKDLLYEMRFDPSTSQYAEFGSFYVGRRFPPADLSALLSGEPVPSEDADGATETGPVHPADADAGHEEAHAHDHDDEARAHAETDADGHSDREHGDAESRGSAHPGSSAEGDHPHDSGVEETEREDVQSLLASLGFHAGDDYAAGDYGLVLYSDAETQELASELDGLRSNFEHYDSHVTSAVRAHGGRAVVVSIWDNEGAADTAHGFLTDLPGITETVRGPLDDSGETETEAADDEGGSESIREELADLDIYAGQPHGEDIYALVLYSEADRDELVAEVEDLSEGFDRYDTHSGTKVYEDPDSERNAVVSLWETEDAADTASDYLSDLPGVVGWAGEGEGFGTMGMFYTVKPEHREDFVEKFGTVGGLLEDMDGHRETALLANVDDENDMFIASQWDSKEDAMGFFRSEAFSDTVDWGRDILADKPRHVFLA